MNDKELIGKIHSAIYHQCQRRGYAAPVDVMMEIGVLPKQKYEDWRFGRVDYLERVCTVNLRMRLLIMQMRLYAQKTGLVHLSVTNERGERKRAGTRLVIPRSYKKR